MSVLRITFECEEKHVGACLTALANRARNLNFEVVEEAIWSKNRPKGAAPAKGRATALVESIIKDHPKGIEYGDLLGAMKAAGGKPQGITPGLRSLLKSKRIVKKGTVYFPRGANG
jgi:hypothetical protein